VGWQRIMGYSAFRKHHTEFCGGVVIRTTLIFQHFFYLSFGNRHLNSFLFFLIFFFLTLHLFIFALNCIHYAFEREIAIQYYDDTCSYRVFTLWVWPGEAQKNKKYTYYLFKDKILTYTCFAPFFPSHGFDIGCHVWYYHGKKHEKNKQPNKVMVV
jgi:hypothetical protein